MAPVPLEGLQTPISNNNVQGALSNPQEGNRGGSIPLAVLIDFIVQRTYHELTVLAELLPRKTDMERKIEIYNFSARTRQLFVRLLALVKWASSASKVDKSARIMAFLDKQSLLFVETADMLARMARETLVHARLPNFHIPAAVEVLTTGTFGRLPACIRDRIVPPDPITPAEKRATLSRLNRVIQHRLVTGELVPQMKNLKIEAGRATFNVEHEFEVSLTVMGDGPNIPWRLLDIRILVEDKETGDGKALVHLLQTQYIHQVLQARLADCPRPLHEVYDVLHYFCQALQLEVLYTQTLRLVRDRLDDCIRVDEYVPGKCLTVSYWRELTSKDPRSELGYRLTVQVDAHDPARPLSVVHVPSLGTKESEIADRAIRSEHLSMERLLVHTIYVRTRGRLGELRTELAQMLKDVECQLQGSPAILSVAVLQPCLRAEQLLITVDTHTGALHCHVPQYDAPGRQPPLIPEIAAALNGDRQRLPALVSELRYWITQRRCEKTLQHLPATAQERLPLLHHPDHPMTKIGRHKMFVQLHKHPNVILIVELKEKESSPCEVECSFHLAVVKHSSIEDNPNDDTIETEIPKRYLKVLTLLSFDAFVVTHGPFTTVDVDGEQDSHPPIAESAVTSSAVNNVGCTTTAKRKSTSNSGSVKEPSSRKAKPPAYFIPELAHVVAMCDEQLPFIALAQELYRRGICHQGLQVEAGATALVLRLVELPAPSDATQEGAAAAWRALQRRLLSVAIRVHGKAAARQWVAELVFHSSPLRSSHPKEQGMRRPVYFQHDMGTVDSVPRTVDALLNFWSQIVHLHRLVYDFANYYSSDKYNLVGAVGVKQYNYSQLVLGYGPERQALVTVAWSCEERQYKLVFAANHGAMSAHLPMREQLEVFLNETRNLARLAHILHETYEPLVSAGRLPTLPQMGVHNNRPQVPVQSFTVLAQSATTLRIGYQGMYCLELRLLGGGLVSLRDGAYSRFDRSHVVEEFTPIQGLKTFLSKYAAETAISRRRSQSEDDNPPSPVAMDQDMSSGATGRQADSVRFHPPLTPPSGSNPHTPASPHANIGQGAHTNFGSSPATSFNMASPPSLSANINPSPVPLLPHPSPGGAVAGSPLNPLHVPSPAGLVPSASPGPSLPGHSPASSFMQTGHTDGSPFPPSQGSVTAALSPAASNWPGSPSVPRPSPAGSSRPPGQSPLGVSHGAIHSPQQPGSSQVVTSQNADHKVVSRVLPQRSWAAAVPTVLTYDALDRLCRPAPHPQGIPGPELAPVERFLGCVYMRRQLQRFIQNEGASTTLTALPSNEPGVVHFKVETLQCRVGLNLQHLQSLHLKVTPLPDHKDQWSAEELQIIEKFFDTRAAVPPYKPNSLCGFGSLINVPSNVLKDFVQIMRLEVVPGAAQQQQLKWAVRWALRVPPAATPIVPCGAAGVLVARNKILFFLQITRIGIQQYGGSEPPSLVLPLVYDASTNLTQLAEKRETPPGAPGPQNAPQGGARRPDQPPVVTALTAASHQLKRFAEFGVNPNECSLYPAVRDLLANLVLPSEPPPQMQPQVVPSPGGVTPTQQQIQSPAMQMHSPMPQQQQPQSAGPQQQTAGPQQGYGPVGMPSMGMMGPQ